MNPAKKTRTAAGLLTLCLLAGCTKLPVSGSYCVFPGPGVREVEPPAEDYLVPCVGSDRYKATARVDSGWQVYSREEIIPNNPNPPLFLQGFGMPPRIVPGRPEEPIILQAGNTPGGTIVIKGYASYPEALRDIDDMFILDFERQVVAGAIIVLSRESGDPQARTQTRKVTMDVELKPGTVSRVTTSTILYEARGTNSGGPEIRYLLKSLAIGCERTCYEANTGTVDRTMESWENR